MPLFILKSDTSNFLYRWIELQINAECRNTKKPIEWGWSKTVHI